MSIRPSELPDSLEYNRNVALQESAPGWRRFGPLEVGVGADHEIFNGARKFYERSLAERSTQDT